MWDIKFKHRCANFWKAYLYYLNHVGYKGAINKRCREEQRHLYYLNHVGYKEGK